MPLTGTSPLPIFKVEGEVVGGIPAVGGYGLIEIESLREDGFHEHAVVKGLVADDIQSLGQGIARTRRAHLRFQAFGQQSRGIQGRVAARDGAAFGMDGPQHPRGKSLGGGEGGEAQGKAEGDEHQPPFLAPKLPAHHAQEESLRHAAPFTMRPPSRKTWRSWRLARWGSWVTSTRVVPRS